MAANYINNEALCAASGRAPKHQNELARVCVLASGSRANSIYVAVGATAVLLDAGMSGVEIERRMQARRLDPRHLSAIIVSHEHADHIQGVGVLSRRYDLPVYISRATYRAASDRLKKLHHLVHFENGFPFQINGIAIHPFPISHDAADPSGFAISGGGFKIGVATDLGMVTEVVRQHLKGCRLLIIEANHDARALLDGPYPWPLKQRIKGRQGHLSNTDARELVLSLMHDGLEHLIMAHLSETNNSEPCVLGAVGDIAGRRGIALTIAGQQNGSPLINMLPITSSAT